MFLNFQETFSSKQEEDEDKMETINYSFTSVCTHLVHHHQASTATLKWIEMLKKYCSLRREDLDDLQVWLMKFCYVKKED